MRFCTTCGQPAGGGNFCGYCGAKLDAQMPDSELAGRAPETPEPARTQDEPAPATPAADQPVRQVAVPPDSPGEASGTGSSGGRKGRGVVVAIGAVAGAVLIAAAAFLVFDGSEASDGSPLVAPDLAERPDIAWRFDGAVDYVEKANNGLLIVSPGFDPDGAVAYGVEPDSGEVRWTRESFDLDVRPDATWCYVPLGDLIVCSTYVVGGGGSAAVALDASDGSQRWMVELPDGWSPLHEVEDELVVASLNDATGDLEVSRLTSDGTVQWTSNDNVAVDDAATVSISAIGMNEQHVLVELAGSALFGFDRATGQPVPWLGDAPMTRPQNSTLTSTELVADEALRVERAEGTTSVERLDHEGAVWTHQQAERADACNDVNYQHLYLCSNGSVTALDWETGTVEWTAGIPDGTNYVSGETEESVVFAAIDETVDESDELVREAALSVIDIASGQQRWQRRTVPLTGNGSQFPVGEQYFYAVEDISGTAASPAPTGDAAVVSYDLDTGEQAWRMPLPQLGERDTVWLTTVDGQLFVINSGQWAVALE